MDDPEILSLPGTWSNEDSSVKGSDNPEASRGPTDLVGQYRALISRLEILLDSPNLNRSSDEDLDDLLLLLRLWGSDIDAENGSLSVLEAHYSEEANHLLSYLLAISRVLDELEILLPPYPERHDQNVQSKAAYGALIYIP
jgi:hypothetical protein